MKPCRRKTSPANERVLFFGVSHAIFHPLHEKGEVGIGVPKEFRGKAAPPHESAAFSFVPLFWRLGQGAARPAGFREVPRYANLFEPPPLIGV